MSPESATPEGESDGNVCVQCNRSVPPDAPIVAGVTLCPACGHGQPVGAKNTFCQRSRTIEDSQRAYDMRAQEIEQLRNDRKRRRIENIKNAPFFACLALLLGSCCAASAAIAHILFFIVGNVLMAPRLMAAGVSGSGIQPNTYMTWFVVAASLGLGFPMGKLIAFTTNRKLIAAYAILTGPGLGSVIAYYFLQTMQARLIERYHAGMDVPLGGVGTLRIVVVLTLGAAVAGAVRHYRSSLQ